MWITLYRQSDCTESKPPLWMRQDGAITLLMTLVLLVLVTGMTFALARLHLTEQKQNRSLRLTQELVYVSDAALEYAIGWLNTSTVIPWMQADENGNTEPGDDMDLPVQSWTLSAVSFSLSARLTRRCLLPSETTPDQLCEQWLIDITATATSAADTSLTRTQYIRVLEDQSRHDFIRVPGSWRDW